MFYSVLAKDLVCHWSQNLILFLFVFAHENITRRGHIDLCLDVGLYKVLSI